MKNSPSAREGFSPLSPIILGLRNRHFFMLDLLIFCAAPAMAIWLRTDGQDNLNGLVYVYQFLSGLALYTLVAIGVRWAVFIPFGLYARYWRYASIDELSQIVMAVVVSTVLIILIFFGFLRPFAFQALGFTRSDVPRTLPFIDAILVLVLVGGLRYSVRWLERVRQRSRKPTQSYARVAIIGAGDAGAMIAKEMQANPQLGLDPVAFLDDDPRKRGAVIHGVRVVGDRHCIADIVNKYQVTQAIIAMPTAPGKTIRELTRLCQEVNIRVKTVPGVFELLEGSVTVNQLRPVDIADLLRREPIVTDLEQVTCVLEGKRVLVTGAGGSIGNELCRQIAKCKPALLILLGHGENSLFETANDLRLAFPKLTMKVVIADIRDADRIRILFQRERPQAIFHAAAHKHVPLMEDNLEDAVSNNIQGTRCLLQCAEAQGVEQFVLISTDKAVNPTSIMGATKRIAELLVQDMAARTDRCYLAVRFGNVLGSRGSVVPFLKQQIARGGPVTITHPEVQRYFMTIPEAAQLVLQAAALGKGGELFVLDMGQPVRIIDLARDLIRLSGLEEGRDIDIVVTGLRPGEKLSEELFTKMEQHRRTSHEKIFVANQYADHASNVRFPNLDGAVEALLAACRGGDVVQVRALIQSIVPEYHRPEPVREPDAPEKSVRAAPPALRLDSYIQPTEG